VSHYSEGQYGHEPIIEPLKEALYRTWQYLEKPKRICSWCDATLTEGSLPATHTICEKCREEKF
jgi:hypothetical protein